MEIAMKMNAFDIIMKWYEVYFLRKILSRHLKKMNLKSIKVVSSKHFLFVFYEKKKRGTFFGIMSSVFCNTNW